VQRREVFFFALVMFETCALHLIFTLNP
jgi:hypothetical protein